MGRADLYHSCDAITAGFRILQRRRGHRYSLDDLATASEAVQARPDARRVLDLGCGIGSVLLMVAWRLRDARLWGIEAQPESAELALRNVALNGLDRVEVIAGDLRQIQWSGPPIDLVTGTPPYLAPGTALASPDPQRAAARIELRGGVEDYLLAAAAVLAPGGAVVICADGRRPERVERGAEAAALVPARRRDVYAHTRARAPLFSVWTLGAEPSPFEELAVCMRDDAGERTEEAHAMRRAFGL